MKKLFILFILFTIFSCKKETIKNDLITVRIFSGEYNYQILVKGKNGTLDLVKEDTRTEKYYTKEFNSKHLKGIFVTVKPKDQANTPQHQVSIDISVNGKTEKSLKGFYKSGVDVMLNHSVNGGIANF